MTVIQFFIKIKLMIAKKDYFVISIIGFLFGLLLLPVLNNIKLPFFAVDLKNAFLLIIGFVIFANLALWLASLLSRFIPVFLQVAKFAAVGGLNTLLDLGILNVLILISGVAVGYWYPVFKGISFVVANINSYFWNKHWTFQETQINADNKQINADSIRVNPRKYPRKSASFKEFSQFLTVSIIGFGINIGIASLIVNIIGAPENISPERWANIGALSATIISLVWNFIGYKFFVFKK